MAKKISKKNISDMIKEYSYPKKTIEYILSNGSNIEIIVDPCVDISTWSVSINSAISAAWSFEDENGNSSSSQYLPGIDSVIYGYAVVSCFSNIKESNTEDLLKIIMHTDIVSKIEKSLPDNILLNYRNDFESALSDTKKMHDNHNNFDILCGLLLDTINSGESNNLNVSTNDVLKIIDAAEKITSIDDNKLIDAIINTK